MASAEVSRTIEYEVKLKSFKPQQMRKVTSEMVYKYPMEMWP